MATVTYGEYARRVELITEASVSRIEIMKEQYRTEKDAVFAALPEP